MPTTPRGPRRPASSASTKPGGRLPGPPGPRTRGKRPAAKTATAPARARPAKPAGRAKQRPRAKPTAALAATIYERLAARYPDAHCELDFRTPFQLLVATILSAQCTDRRVNMVTPVLFARYPTVASLAAARQEDVEEIIRSTGFFRSKARSIIRMANALVDRHGGEVPGTMDALLTLPGVGRKTANVILGNAFDRNDGVVVDTHVGRLALRLGLTRETDPAKVELDLMRLFEQPRWTMLAHLLIWHGRRVCDAKRPRCGECTLAELCPSAQV